MNIKPIIYALISIVVLSQLPMLLDSNYDKYDVFIGSDAEIYLQNIVYDVIVLINNFILLLIIFKLSNLKLRRFVFPFIIVSILDFFDYFIAYSKYSYIKILLLIVLLIFTYANEKNSNTWRSS